MTTKSISGTYSAGYLLNSQFTEVSITSTGSVGGFGLVINGYAEVRNDGHLLASNGADGVLFGSGGGSLTNLSGGSIAGGQAIGASGAGAAGNSGGAGAHMTVYGQVLNANRITGGLGGAGVAGSFGGDGGDGGAGTTFHASGLLTNNGGQITGGAGGAAGASNYSTQVRGATGGFGGAGVDMAGYGSLYNANGGLIGGAGGTGGASTGIGGYGGVGGAGIDLAAGGYIDIEAGSVVGGLGGHCGYGPGGAAGAGGRGGAGIALTAGGRVFNHGYITGGLGGIGKNGETQSYQQLGQGGDGVDVVGGLVENYRVIAGGNGGTAVPGARPGTGGDGVRASGGTVLNYGSIYGGAGGYSHTVKAFAGYGVSMAGAGSITNGSSSVGTAFIEGNGAASSEGANYNGAGVVAAALSQVTLTNWGTISGGYGHKADGGTAVFLGSNADVLVAEAGSVFLGAIDCAGGTLELGAGFGTLSGIDANGQVTVTGFLGSGSNTLFSDFATVEIDAGGEFTTAATATIAAGKTLIDNGRLIDNGTLNAAGTIAGNGILYVNGLTFESGSALSVDQITAGAKTSKISVDSNLVYAGLWDETLGTLTVSARKTFELTGATDYLTGKRTINHGNLEYAGTSQLYISKALVNDGQMIVQSGQVILETECTVSGSGDAQIKGGELAAEGAFNQNVFFEGAGTLVLDGSQSYTAQIAGFSTTGTDFLDLGDIGFVGANEATFSGNANGGVLTVSDGTHTAHIALAGDFLSSSFVCASDGFGGVTIHDPTAPAGAPPPAAHGLIQAMAALGGVSAAIVSHATEPWLTATSTLTAPHRVCA